MPHDPCITITAQEYKDVWGSQTPGAVFCNRCELKGRYNYARHVRERHNGMCPCCRREYQSAYYAAKKAKGTGKDVLKLLYTIKKQQDQVYVYYKTRNTDVMLQVQDVHLPELNKLEEAIGQRITTMADLQLRLEEERLPEEVPDWKIEGRGMEQLMEIGKEMGAID